MAWNIVYYSPDVQPVYGLEFPSNGDSPVSTMVAFRFTGANYPGAYPATLIWQVKPVQQNGYYTTFFSCNTQEVAYSASGYYGSHPYPENGLDTGTVHSWEISTVGLDLPGDPWLDNNSNDMQVVKDQWYTQAMTVRLVNTNELEFILWWDLGTASTRKFTYTTTNDWANTFPPTGTPGLVFGDAPWSAGNERLSGTLGPVKYFDAQLSEADVISEAADMTQIVTSAGSTNRWWFKETFDSADDLTDSVTGVSASWYNTNKATRVLIG